MFAENIKEGEGRKFDYRLFDLYEAFSKFVEENMKKTYLFKYAGVVSRLGLLCLFICCLAGCMQGEGQTRKEIDQMHMRKINTGTKQMQDDIDMMLLMDQPSRLSDKAIR